MLIFSQWVTKITSSYAFLNTFSSVALHDFTIQTVFFSCFFFLLYSLKRRLHQIQQYVLGNLTFVPFSFSQKSGCYPAINWSKLENSNFSLIKQRRGLFFFASLKQLTCIHCCHTTWTFSLTLNRLKTFGINSILMTRDRACQTPGKMEHYRPDYGGAF